MTDSKQPLSDYLRERYVGDDPKRQAALEEARRRASVARQVYALRVEAGLTQKQLAELIDTKPSVISRLESDDYEGHSMKTLKRIAAVLGRRVVISFEKVEETASVGVPGKRKTKRTRVLAKRATEQPKERVGRAAHVDARDWSNALLETPKEQVEGVRLAVDRLRSAHGKPAGAPTRVDQVVSTLEGYAESGSVGRREVRQALIDAYQLRKAAEHLASFGDPSEPGLVQTLKRLFTGNLLPDPGEGAAGKAQQGHNAQFELFMAAILCEDGYSVSLGEPDIVATRDDWTFYVAAKRIVSAKQIRKNIKRGAEQVRERRGESWGQRQSGLIALDVTWLGNPEGLAPILKNPTKEEEQACPDRLMRCALGVMQAQKNTMQLTARLAHEFGVDATVAVASCATLGLDGRNSSSHGIQTWRTQGCNDAALAALRNHQMGTYSGL